MKGWISVRVGLHRGSVLSPFLFDLIIDVLSSGVLNEAPRCMLFADSIVLYSINHDKVERNVEKLKKQQRTEGYSKKKTEFIKFCDERGNKVRLRGEILKRVEKFKYLELSLTENEKLGRRFPVEYMKKLEENLGVLCESKNQG